MKLQEHRSKEILARHGVPLLAGETATTPEEARGAAERIGGPVVVKAQFVYQLPWNMLTSFNFQSQSGRPIIQDVRPASSLTRIPGTNNVVANVVDGELRTSQWTTLDARVEKAISLGGTAELAVFGDFLNLFNSDANESVLDRRPTSANYLVPSRFILPRRLMVGAKFRF